MDEQSLPITATTPRIPIVIFKGIASSPSSCFEEGYGGRSRIFSARVTKLTSKKSLHFSLTKHACLFKVICLVYSSTLNMKAKSSSQTSVDFQRTAQRYVPEVRILFFQLSSVHLRN
jgi:hypothetical protein